MGLEKKLEKRVVFSLKDKYFYMTKSNCLCARCGTQLYVDTMTVEHVIPLSKGGSNKRVNLVALCESCNINKDNNLYLPSQYYKYLSEQELFFLDGDYRKFTVGYKIWSKEGDKKIEIKCLSPDDYNMVEDIVLYFFNTSNCNVPKFYNVLDELLLAEHVFGVYIENVILGIIIREPRDSYFKYSIVPIEYSPKTDAVLTYSLIELLEKGTEDYIRLSFRRGSMINNLFSLIYKGRYSKTATVSREEAVLRLLIAQGNQCKGGIISG